MLRSITLVLFLIIGTIAHAQSSRTVKGQTVDSNNSPVPFATITFQQTGNPTFQDVITNEEGYFSIEGLREASYTVTVFSIGYKDTVFTYTPDANLLKLILKEEPNVLREVSVTTSKPIIERKLDRIIFNVAESAALVGGNALETLAKTPGVRVQDEEIRLAGKNSLRVMIDGRLLKIGGSGLSNLLKSIPSDEIVRVELITNPPAKYEAEGNAGIIHIITKKSRSKGYAGSVRVADRMATYHYMDLTGNFQLTQDKLNIHANGGLAEGSMQILQDAAFTYPTQYWEQASKREHFLGYTNGNVGIEYDLSKATTVGIAYTYSTSRPDMEESISIGIGARAAMQDSLLQTSARTERQQSYHNISAHSLTKLDTTGKTLSVGVDYLRYKDTNLRDFNTITSFPRQNIAARVDAIGTRAAQGIAIYTAKTDLEIPFKHVKLTTGGKLSLIQNNSNIRYERIEDKGGIVDSSRSNQFEYEEHIQALYVSGQKAFGKWELQVGIRGEFTQTDGFSQTLKQRNTYNYFQLFPTVFSSFTPNENNAITMSYGKRIGRPNYEYLNPFKWYSSPYSYFEGNPFLRPSFTHNLEVGHTFQNFLSSSFYYSFTKQEIEQITLQDGAAMATRYLNSVDFYSLGITESFSYSFTPWWESHTQLQPYYTVVLPNSRLGISRQASWSGYVSSSNSFVISKDKPFTASLNMWYQLPEVSGAYRLEGYGNISFGVRTSLFKKKIIAGISYADIFKMQVQRYRASLAQVDQRFESYNDSRRLTLSLSYKFAKNKVKGGKSRNGNTEEKGRL